MHTQGDGKVVKLVVGLMAIAAIGWSQSADLTHAELAVQDAIQAGDLAAASRLKAIGLDWANFQVMRRTYATWSNKSALMPIHALRRWATQ